MTRPYWLVLLAGLVPAEAGAGDAQLFADLIPGRPLAEEELEEHHGRGVTVNSRMVVTKSVSSSTSSSTTSSSSSGAGSSVRVEEVEVDLSRAGAPDASRLRPVPDSPPPLRPLRPVSVEPLSRDAVRPVPVPPVPPSPPSLR